MLTLSRLAFTVPHQPVKAVCFGLILSLMCSCAVVETPDSTADTQPATQAVKDDNDSDPQAAIASDVPDTDIFVFQIDLAAAQLVVSFDANVTSRAGYDNQPGYIPGTNDLLFSSILDGRQSDVHRYVESSGVLTQITTTELSEFSPTPLAQGGFSAVVVEEDGTQRLWRYAESGNAVESIRGDVTGVGYHAWLKNDQLGLFIVDEPLMHLDVAGVSDTSRYTLAVNPGRSLHARPVTETLSFVQHREGELSRLMDWDGEKVTALVDMPEKVEDMTWLPDGRAITISNGKLLAWATGDKQWQEVADLSAYLPGDVTRLSVNDSGTRLAVVSSMDSPAPTD
ncbi:MAG: hypothetical protein AB8G18_09155 [Gammaproteobacteria bacterium]